MKLTPEELEATVRLLHNDDFQRLFNAMGNHAEGLNKRLVIQKLDTGDLHNLQGQTRNMVTLLETISGAPQQLEKLSQPKT